MAGQPTRRRPECRGRGGSSSLTLPGNQFAVSRRRVAVGGVRLPGPRGPVLRRSRRNGWHRILRGPPAEKAGNLEFLHASWAGFWPARDSYGRAGTGTGETTLPPWRRKMCDALVAPAVGTALLLTALSLPAADDSTATVVDAERSFARYSVEHGMREAFLQFLADDAILFRPLPVNGKKWFEGRPPAPGALLWQPTYARVSEAGDLGVTSGPWEFKPSDTTAASSFGHFLTVWRKQADGTWRVELDAGIGHPRLDRTPELDARADPAREPVLLSPSASARAAQSLLAAERRLGKLAANWGLAEALAARATGDFRLYRHDAPP